MNTLLFPEEYALQLQIGKALSLGLVCTQEHLQELIYGFLYNEGLISSVLDVESVIFQGNTAKIVLKGTPAALNPLRGTGLGGMLLSREGPLHRCLLDRRFSLDTIRRFADTMTAQAKLYQKTGGMHCSALCDDKYMIAAFEDIGRHNTIDKLTGHCLLQNVQVSDCLLITTGRISQDMVRKAARLGTSVVVSYSTPTQQAAETARKANITLVRYLGKSCTLCTVPERIVP